MKRLCVIFHQGSTSLFTLDDLLRRFHLASVSIKPRTLSRYLIYFRDKEIIEFLKGDKGQKVYRCSDTNKALAYIEGRYQEYAGQVAPRRPPIRPEGTVRHRPNHKIRLEGEELEKAKSIGVWRKKGKPPGYHHIVSDGFNMKVWSSGKAHVFLIGDWRSDMMHIFGPTVTRKVDDEVLSGNGHEGVAVPQKGKLPKEWQDHLPVKSIARVYSDSGLITTFRYGYSQVPEGELDRHGPVNEPYANQVEAWLESELQFKTDVRNLFTNQANKIDRLIELQEQMPEAIGEAVSKAIEKLMNEPKKEPEYKNNDGKDEDEIMFG